MSTPSIPQQQPVIAYGPPVSLEVARRVAELVEEIIAAGKLHLL